MGDSGWNGINEGSDTGNIVEDKLTSAFNNIDDSLDTKLVFDDMNKVFSLQLKLGVDVDTLFANGEYEVDTNLPSGATGGYLRVQEVYDINKVLQTFTDNDTHSTYKREYLGATWSAWVLDNTSNKLNELENKNTYDFKKVSGVNISDNNWVTVATLLTPNRKAGVYEYKFSMIYQYSSTSRSAMFRVSTDGGVNWNEFAKEPKDTTDKYPLYYMFPTIRFDDEPINIIVEAQCENANDTLSVLSLDIVSERKGQL